MNFLQDWCCHSADLRVPKPADIVRNLVLSFKQAKVPSLNFWEERLVSQSKSSRTSTGWTVYPMFSGRSDLVIMSVNSSRKGESDTYLTAFPARQISRLRISANSFSYFSL